MTEKQGTLLKLLLIIPLIGLVVYLLDRLGGWVEEQAETVYGI